MKQEDITLKQEEIHGQEELKQKETGNEVIILTIIEIVTIKGATLDSPRMDKFWVERAREETSILLIQDPGNQGEITIGEEEMREIEEIFKIISTRGK